MQSTELRSVERTFILGRREVTNSNYFIIILYLMKTNQPINLFGNRSECGCAIFGFSVGNILVFQIETNFVTKQCSGMNLDF